MAGKVGQRVAVIRSAIPGFLLEIFLSLCFHANALRPRAGKKREELHYWKRALLALLGITYSLLIPACIANGQVTEEKPQAQISTLQSPETTSSSLSAESSKLLRNVPKTAIPGSTSLSPELTKSDPKTADTVAPTPNIPAKDAVPIMQIASLHESAPAEKSPSGEVSTDQSKMVTTSEVPKPNVTPAGEPLLKPVQPAKEPVKQVAAIKTVNKPKPSPQIKPTPPKAAVPKVADKPIAVNQNTNGDGFISRIVTATKGLVTRAFSWLGTKYIWGGFSAKGVDCSGLTKLLYQKEGVNLPRTAKQQFQKGQPITRNALLPGDLVFFNTPRGPLTHVGMYVGNGQFVHAANPRRGVRVDRLNTDYFLKRFAGARRYKSFG